MQPELACLTTQECQLMTHDYREHSLNPDQRWWKLVCDRSVCRCWKNSAQTEYHRDAYSRTYSLASPDKISVFGRLRGANRPAISRESGMHNIQKVYSCRLARHRWNSLFIHVERVNMTGIEIWEQMHLVSLHPEHLDCVGTASSGRLALFLKVAGTQVIKQYASHIRSWRDR